MSKEKTKAILVNFHVKPMISLLSTEAESPNYRGFMNLGAIILIVANFRLIIENILRYGLLLSHPLELIHDFISIACIVTYLLNIIPITLAFYLETKYAITGNRTVTYWCHGLIQIYMLTAPIFSIYYYRVHFVPASVLLMLTLIISMKIYSFSDIMHDARSAYESQEYLKYPKELKQVLQKYPKIVTKNQFIYFLCAPTMCFQFFYPRSEKIRVTWLIKRIVEYIVSLSLMLILIQQYITPLILNTIPVIQEENINYILLLERHLKLCLPNLYLWLFLFYSGFQCAPNIVSEVLCFADRKFYNDWWNSRTLGEYWKNWNLPVHNWLLRHVYFPMIAKGYGKTFSLFITFFISAVAHEYLVSGACRLLTYWAFLAMMMQIPMIVAMDIFKKQLEKTQIGNVVFWVSFCIIGQPIAVLIYAYQAFQSLNH